MKITLFKFAYTCAREKKKKKKAAPGLTANGIMSFFKSVTFKYAR